MSDMRSKTIRGLALLLALLPAPVSADSPLTSTDFHQDYANVPEVDHVRAHGLDAQTIASLRNPAVPHDVRAAMVNALGWSIHGQTHAQRFAAALARAHGVRPAALRPDHLSVEESFALGYLAALDDYFELSAVGGTTGLAEATPIALLEQAARRASDDFSVALVLALVHAQAALDAPDGACKVWTTVQTPLRAWPQPSMRPAAVQRITDYIDLYRCE